MQQALITRTRCVLILTASMGSGHVHVARELGRRMHRAGVGHQVVDVLAAAGPSGARLRRTYRLLLDRAPWLYDAAMRTWLRHPQALQHIALRSAGQLQHAVRDVVADVHPDVVVSTYNLASQALGELVASGEVQVPTATVVTDPGAHPYWVHPGIRLHIAPLPMTAARLAEFGARWVVTAPPLVGAHTSADVGGAVDRHAARQAARSSLDLPDGRVVLVNAGSWAVGRLTSTVDAVHGDDTYLVVLCGRNDALRRRLSGRPQVRAVGWTDHVETYLTAADVVVDNAGGLTCWEALHGDTPVVLFDPLPGHGRLNAEALADTGLARYASRAGELRAALDAPVRPDHRQFCGDPVEQHVLGLLEPVASDA